MTGALLANPNLKGFPEMPTPAPFTLSLLLWIGPTDVMLMEFPGERNAPVEHHYPMNLSSPIHRLKTYMELARHLERHHSCALSGPGMEKHHFLTWLFGHGSSLVNRIVTTEDRLSGTRQSLIRLRADLIRRFRQEEGHERPTS
jgi:hypothetical protein